MVICLERGANCLHMVQLMPMNPKTPLSLASFKSRLLYLSGTGLPRLSWKRGRLTGVIAVVSISLKYMTQQHVMKVDDGKAVPMYKTSQYSLSTQHNYWKFVIASQ